MYSVIAVPSLVGLRLHLVKHLTSWKTTCHRNS